MRNTCGDNEWHAIGESEALRDPGQFGLVIICSLLRKERTSLLRAVDTVTLKYSCLPDLQSCHHKKGLFSIKVYPSRQTTTTVDQMNN